MFSHIVLFIYCFIYKQCLLFRFTYFFIQFICVSLLYIAVTCQWMSRMIYRILNLGLLSRNRNQTAHSTNKLNSSNFICNKQHMVYTLVLFILRNWTFKPFVIESFSVTQVKEARRTLKKPQVEKFDCTQHKQTFWCYCCSAEVEKHVTDDNMTVIHGGLVEHMAT